MRTVRLYDATRQPRDWMDIIQPGQFAVFASLLDGGAPTGADGVPTSHAEATCVIVDGLAEAEALCRDAVQRHPALRFDVFDDAGRGRSALLTIVHPSRASRLEGDASGGRRNVVIAAVLIVASPVLFWMDWQSGGVLVLPTLLACNLLLFAGRLLQVNAAHVAAERRRLERVAGRDQSGHVVRCLLMAATLTCVSGSAGFAQTSPDPPPLPRIVAEGFPEASRAAIAAAVHDAQQRPADANVVGALAMLLQAWQQFDTAAVAYQRAQALAPDNADWWYLGGLTDTARAEHASAARQFARAASLAPGRAALVSLRLADARLAAGADGEAATVYRQLLSVPDHAAAAWYGLGRVALRRDDDAAALDALQKAVALSPEYGAAHYALAQVHRRAGNAAAAAVALVKQQRCPACGPFVDDPWQVRVAALRDDALARLTRGIAAASASATEATAEAIKWHEAALDRPETRGLAHLNLIELYRRVGDVERAKQHYQAALDQPGFEADAHRQYAAVLLEQQSIDEALLLFERATTQAPRDAAAWQGRGLALERLGRFTDAADAYGAALQVAPDAHQARFGLARLAMRSGQVDQAIGHLETLRTPHRAETPRYLFALSTAYLRRGRQADALRVATEALTLARQLGDEPMATFIDGEIRKLRPTP